MANRWTEDSDSGEQTKSDLNPLLNPMLEENLGRWAQVYFTNPPEKRERAVMDLLRELENRSTGQPTETAPLRNSGATGPAVQKVPCAVCNGENRPDQKFCGFCGTPLRAQPLAEQAAPHLEPAPQGESMSFLGLSPSAPPENDLAFLREKSFEKAYYEPDSGPHRVRYMVAALVILAGGITYLSWPVLRTHLPRSWQMSLQTQVAPAAPPASPGPQSPATMSSQPAAPVAATAAPQSPAPAAQRHAEDQAKAPSAGPAKSQEPSANGPDLSTHSVTLASDTHASHGVADGSQELLLAERYLHEGDSATNRAQAARWLWKSVSKQNPHAALLLADMYTRGDGVSKSCDQARILLGAAAGKGLQDAALKLHNLESSGCH